jgi:outer membrane lipoprotein-sorting protein
MIGKVQSASDFKLGKKDKVAGKEAYVVEYQLTRKGGLGEKQETNPVTVWIDVKTNLPVKRMITLKEGQGSFSLTETYTNIVLDQPIDDKTFALPK